MTPRAARVLLPIYLAGIYGTLSVVRVLTEALREAGLLRLSVAVAFGVAGAAVLFLLWRDRRSRVPRVWIAVALAAGAYAAAIYPMHSPEEKLHFIQYGLLAVLALVAAPARWSWGRRYLGAALFTAAAGWVDELIQGLLPTRHYDLRDVGFNALAGVFALSALAAIRWARRPATSAGSAS